jgi:hypothetical protein
VTVLALTDAAAQVIAAGFALLGVVVTVAWRANRREHAENSGKLDTLIDNQDTIRREVSYIRADVTDIHGAISELRRTDRDTDSRVTRLERHRHGGDAA